jgi:hypothetical protein
MYRRQFVPNPDLGRRRSWEGRNPSQGQNGGWSIGIRGPDHDGIACICLDLSETEGVRERQRH